MKKLKKSVNEMVSAAKARITEITAEEAKKCFADDDVLIVDIRDVRERQNLGFIPGSYHAPRGMLEFWIDPESPYHKEIFGEDKRFIFHCAAGWRSALAVATLNDMGFEAEHISDGFAGWIKADGPIEYPKAKKE